MVLAPNQSVWWVDKRARATMLWKNQYFSPAETKFSLIWVQDRHDKAHMHRQQVLCTPINTSRLENIYLPSSASRSQLLPIWMAEGTSSWCCKQTKRVLQCWTRRALSWVLLAKTKLESSRCQTFCISGKRRRYSPSYSSLYSEL